MKRIIFFFLAVLLVLPLASCTTITDENSGEINMNLLEESRVTLSEVSPWVLDICTNDNGYTIVSTDENQAVLHRSSLTVANDGQGELSNPVEIARVESSWRIFAATISPEGNIIYSCALTDDIVKHYLINTEGMVEELELAPNAIVSLDYVNSESLIAEDLARNLMRINVSSGKVEASYELNDGQLFSSYAITGAQLIAITSESVDDSVAYSAKIFDLASGDETSDSAELVQAIDSVLTRDELTFLGSEPLLSQNPRTGELSVLSHGSLYLINNNEVSLQAAGDDTNLLNTVMFPEQLLPNDKGFVVLYSEIGISIPRLYSYSYGRPKAEKKLTIYMLEENAEVKRTAALFREQNKNLEVVIQVGLPSETTLTVDDAIKQLNLDILAGNGPDVIVLDDLSATRFQKEKLLVNLDDVVNRSKTTGSEYFENVLTCFKDEGFGCYALPTRFTIPSIMINEELLNRIQSMEDLTEVVESYKNEEQAFLNINCDLSLLFSVDYKNIVGGSSVSKEELSRFFEESKRLLDVSAENLKTPNTSPTQGNTHDAIDFALEGFTSGRPYGLGGVTGLLVNSDSAQISSITCISDLPCVNLTIDNSENDLAFNLLKFTDKQVFTPCAILGVSSSSSNANLAKQFIEFSLSDEQQKSGQWLGLPVNKTAFEKTLGEASATKTEVSFGGEYSFSYGPLSNEEVQAHFDLVNSVEAASVTDRIITDLVKEGLEPYLRDQISLDEAVESTYQKLSLYILEQS